VQAINRHQFYFVFSTTSYNVLVIRTMNWEIGEWAWDGTEKNKFNLDMCQIP
jgi:hypothetical protein